MTDEAIKKMWRIFAVESETVLELRALWPGGGRPPLIRHFRGEDYASVDECCEAFEISALDLNAQGYNIYIVMNAIHSGYGSSDAVKDVDIAYRKLLLIDIDRAGDTKNPATDEELQSAHETALMVRQYLSDQGWSSPIMVMSGNGYHLYYVLDDVENTPKAKDMVKGVLSDLAARFNNDRVSIDRAVHNASRITKVPGTVARKGQETRVRPYRVAEVCDG